MRMLLRTNTRILCCHRLLGLRLWNSSKRMDKSDPDDSDNHRLRITSKSNPTVELDRFQQVLHKANGSGGDGWEQCWQQGLTPWDLGTPTPILVHLHRTGSLPKGRALVPGCGTGYDVVAIASPQRYVIGLDISGQAINKALQLTSSQPKSSHFTFLRADFFTWHPTHLFDLIFDYTFFCAIEPHLRSAWAEKVGDILKPDGELITLMFPIGDHVSVGGPPYKVSVSDYEKVLHPMGFNAISIVDNELAVGPRKGREKLGRWKRSLTKSYGLKPNSDASVRSEQGTVGMGFAIHDHSGAVIAAGTRVWSGGKCCKCWHLEKVYFLLDPKAFI
ncbi:TPMT family [Parasponia andersonii]|uniref:TPMT family n=1 Tax=Parasponia andersonii TaxID=3476 RepID=A0A2P5BD58_PARAD|nr:TPMT family [Parasponia andersonii]